MEVNKEAMTALSVSLIFASSAQRFCHQIVYFLAHSSCYHVLISMQGFTYIYFL
jgi:hypothetical protein